VFTSNYELGTGGVHHLAPQEAPSFPSMLLRNESR